MDEETEYRAVLYLDNETIGYHIFLRAVWGCD